MIQEAIRITAERTDLTRKQAYQVMHSIMAGESTPAQIGAFLMAVKLKGAKYQEVAGFAEAMREKALKVTTKHERAIDMCGTGGDGAGTFNVSTVASFVVAAGGVAVAKHGNRSVSSKCGSADLLEALGVKIDLTAGQIGKCLDELRIGFLYAPALHKAMKYAVGPRREIGVRTVFNILGPITNPAMVRRQVLGVYHPGLAHLMAKVLQELGADHILIVHSEDGLDEISIQCATLTIEVINGTITEKRLHPDDFGLPLSNDNGVCGGTPAENAQIALDILSGKKGSPRDIVVANAASGLVVGSVASTFLEGAQIAQECIDSGAALRKLEELKNMSNDINA